MTSNGIYSYEADGFADFMMMEGGRLPNPKPCPKYQKNILVSMESAVNYPFVRSIEEANKRGYPIDLLMTYRLDSDVNAGYFGYVNYTKEYEENKNKKKKENAIAVAYISNCGNQERIRIIKELISHGVTIDLFGHCFRNPTSRNIEKNLNSYYFTLAFENSVDEDYVTEKYWQALSSLSIPVVLGASNIHDFEPAEKSILYVKDFKNTAELAKTMIRIANNETEFWEMLKWKLMDRPPLDTFNSIMDINDRHSHCRLCIKLGDLLLLKYNMNFLYPTEGIYIRERNTFYFRKLLLSKSFFGKEKINKKQLHDSIKKTFKNYVPIWAYQRPGFNGTLNVYRVYSPFFVNQHDALFHFPKFYTFPKINNKIFLEVIFI